MNQVKALIICAIILLISGCAVQTKVTAFYTEEASTRGSIVVLPANESQSNSLEFSSIAKKLEGNLIQVGYSKYIGNGKPDYFATVRYAIDSGRTTLENDGTTGIEFTREINIDIFKITKEKPQKTYEITATSVGSCRTVTAVLPAIFDGIFEKFPPKNGVTENRVVKWNGKC